MGWVLFGLTLFFLLSLLFVGIYLLIAPLVKSQNMEYRVRMGRETYERLEAFAKISDEANPFDVLGVALDNHEWILEEQTMGRVILSVSREKAGQISGKENFAEVAEFEHLIKDQEAALKYFCSNVAGDESESAGKKEDGN